MNSADRKTGDACGQRQTHWAGEQPAQLMMDDSGRYPVASSTVARRRLALELRQLRERARKSGDTVAKALYWSPSKISRYEWARTVPVPGEVAKLLAYYQVTGPQHDYLLQLAQTAHEPGWWNAYTADIPAHQRDVIGLEHAAAEILIWQAHMVPALLQTEAYARQVIGGYRQVEPIPPGQASRRVTVTMLRQHLLARETPPQVTVVLEESILRRPAADAQVMHEQLRLLAELASGHPAVTLHVLPLTRPQLFTGSFTLLGFGSATPEEGLPDVVAIDHFTGGCLIEDEREAYLYRLAFWHLAAEALDPAATRSFLHDLAGSSCSSDGSR
ncbi:MAG: helix-turn-helix domain-containing protein [Streptosporangiaceae bacterium]